MNSANRGFGLLFWINAAAFALYALLAFWPALTTLPLVGYLHSVTALFVAFFVTGQSIAAILEAALRTRFSFFEKIAVIALAGLLIPPLAVTLLSHVSGDWLPFVPILLAGSLGVISLWVRPFFWEETEVVLLSPHFIPATLLAVTFSFMLVFQLTTAYYALPDFDPYYWLQKFQTEYGKNQVTDIRLHRPLFSSLGYIFFQTAGIDLYAYFKYILPSLMLVVLVPAALVANRMRRLSDTLLVFLLPAVSGSFLLYSFSSIPQAILNLSFLSGIYLVVHALVSRRPVFYFFAGSVFFLSMLYHEMAVLFFLPWSAVTLFVYRTPVLTLIRNNPVTALLTVILILSHLAPALFEMGRFLLAWTDRILSGLIQFQPNLAFPATYINVDGNAVGWGDWSGVLRYYAFYLGPLAGSGLLILVWYATRQHLPVLVRVERSTLERAAYGFLVSLFLLFFAMAEFLPRLFNIALLPERAMGFFGFIALAFLLIILIDARRPWPILFTAVLIGAAFVNAGAALYINAEKRFLITPTQISSAEWIRGSLPNKRIILTGSHWNLIRFHSQTETAIEIDDPLFYRDIRVFDAARRNLPSEHQLYRRSFAAMIAELEASLKRLESLDPVTERERVYAELVSGDSSLRAFLGSKFSDADEDTSGATIYIYYAKPSSENPYANRPYMNRQSDPTTDGGLVFDRYPDRFRRIYQLPGDEVVIWELIQ